MSPRDPNSSETPVDLGPFGTALAFLTRLPLGRFSQTTAPTDLAASAWTFPLVGLVVGIAGGIVILIARGLGFDPWLAAGLGVAATVLLTGAMHEDGLADTADGFGGGATAAEKLAIMRDSRIGAYGALALIFALTFRIGTLAAIIPYGGWRAMFLLAGAEAASRGAMVRFWHELPAARADGLSASAGRPDEQSSLIALALSGVIAAILLWIGVGFWSALVAVAGTIAAAYVFGRLSANQIDGQTGDTLGACQQVAILVFLLLAVAFH